MAIEHLNVDLSALQAFCKRWKVSELSLFGSVLREDFSPDSDIDVLISWLPDAHVTLLTMGDMAEELELILGRKVDLVSKRGLKPVIREQVINSSQQIYHAA